MDDLYDVAAMVIIFLVLGALGYFLFEYPRFGFAAVTPIALFMGMRIHNKMNGLLSWKKQQEEYGLNLTHYYELSDKADLIVRSVHRIDGLMDDSVSTSRQVDREMERVRDMIANLRQS